MTTNPVDNKDDNTYFFDPESAQEMARLLSLDRFVNRNSGMWHYMTVWGKKPSRQVQG